MSDRTVEVLQDMLEMDEYTRTQAVEILKVAELRRIADELTGMNTALINLQRAAEAVEDCVTKTERGSLLCITGNVTNYEG